LVDFLGSTNDKLVAHAVVALKQAVDDSFFVWLRPGLAIDSLTQRELEVAQLLAEGLKYKEIAKRLEISPATVRSHLQRLHSKLDVRTNAELIAKCYV
jgi:DNA-binding CsgD family transcriptional regulator